MPTHKELPLWYLDERPKRRRRRIMRRGLAVVLFGGFVAAAPRLTALTGPATSSSLPHTPVSSAPPVQAVNTTTRPRTRSGAAHHLFLRGTSLPGPGRTPRLLVFSDSGHLTVRSMSPMPVVVSVSDGYAHPMRYLMTLLRGQDRAQTVVTGRWYGYCFSQGAGAGYAATRGCASMNLHEYLNGARLPDGAAATRNFGFARGS
jgi:hypothetical protein